MNKNTADLLKEILKRSEEEGGEIRKIEQEGIRSHMDWMIAEGYIRTAIQPVHTFTTSSYMMVMPTQKAYDWEEELRTRPERHIEEILEQIKKGEEEGSRKREAVEGVAKLAERVGRAWCRSSMGDHTNVYYKDLKEVPRDAHWDTMRGMLDDYGIGLGTTVGEWETYTNREVKEAIFKAAGIKEEELQEYAEGLFYEFEQYRDALMAELEQAEGEIEESTRVRLLEKIKRQKEQLTNGGDEARRLAAAYMPRISQDAENLDKGPIPAAHQEVLGNVEAVRRLQYGLKEMGRTAEALARGIKRYWAKQEDGEVTAKKVFIGRGGTGHTWRAVKDHLVGKGWEVEEFEQGAMAGGQIQSRLEKMMEGTRWGVIVATRDTEQEERTRENVIHEIGYAQGRLGWGKVIILKQHECKLPSNLDGTLRIDFNGDEIESTFLRLDKRLEEQR